MIIDARAGELVEEFVGTGYLAFLYLSDVEGRHAALGLSYEIHVLHRALLEGDSPVGRIVAHRGRDVETLWQLGIYRYVGRGIEVFHKLPFHTLLRRSIRKDIIDDALLALECLVERGMLLLSEDGGVVAALYLVVADAFYDDGSLLLHDEAAHSLDKLLRIHLVHIKLAGQYPCQDVCHRAASQLGVAPSLPMRQRGRRLRPTSCRYA